MNPLQRLLDELVWRDVPTEVVRLVKLAAGPYAVIQDLIPHLPEIDAQLWYNPDMEKLAIAYPEDANSNKVASWYIALKQVPGIETIEQCVPPNTFIRIKRATPNASIFGPIASVAQMKPNEVNKLWGGPNPLSATLAGGLLGAGAGYGIGALAEQLLPEEYFEKGKLRRTTGIMGGLAGAGPGLWWGMDNATRAPNPNNPEQPGLGWPGWVSSHPYPQLKKQSRFTNINEGLVRVLPKEALELNEQWEKYASDAGADFDQMIPVDQFNRTIWNDLHTAGGFTAPPLAAATTGLVQAASLASGVNMISPMDIARIGIGMGSGYMASRLVGRTLGALAGLRPEAQDALQRAGTWAGILGNVIPIIFR